MSSGGELLRGEFPLLAGSPKLHYLDSAATAQIHRVALEALLAHESRARANVLRGNYALAEAADRAYDEARRRVSKFLNAARPDEVIFTSGATASINLACACLGAGLCAGDEVVVSAAEHHSNFVPWQQLCRARAARLRVVPLTGEGRIDLSELERAITRRCRVVALTHCSNVTGAQTDLAFAISLARPAGALVLADGAQAVQHGPVDVAALGVDLYAFSGHKCFGPTGVGVLWGRRALLETLPPFMTGGGMIARVGAGETTFAAPPQRFEAGTPPIAPAVALGAALDWMAGLDWAEIRAREAALCSHLIEGVLRTPGARLIGPRAIEARAPIVSFVVDGLHPHDICQVADGFGVALRGGHHCAQPLMDAFGIDGSVRASIALYNDERDIDAALAALAQALRVLR